MDEIKILDGSFSAQLSKHINETIDDHPLWTSRFLLTDPDAVKRTHLDYLRAGSEIIETGTYQASIPGFVKYLELSENESFDLIKKAVFLAKEAVSIFRKENVEKGENREVMIAGSCGSYGAALHDCSEYTGSYASNPLVTREILMDFHRPRIRALLEAKVDILAIETIPCEKEADALVTLLGEFPDAKAWISFSCLNDGKSLADGSSFKEVATRCYEKTLPGQIVAVGVNCIGPKYVKPLLECINGGKQEKERLPLIVYPNSGEKYIDHKWSKDGVELLPLESFVHCWLDLGVKFIGSCCRSDSDSIVKLKMEVTEWQKNKKI